MERSVSWKFLWMGPLLGLLLGLLLAGGANGQSLDLDKQGLVLRNAAGQELQRLPLRAKRWDQRALPDGKQVALLQDADSGALHLIESDGLRLRERLRFQAPAVALESLCLYRDAQGLLQAVLLGDDGRSEQWLLDGPKPRLIRPWATPPKAQACAVRDAEAQLYLVEEGLGLWQLAVDPEREGRRLLLQDAQADAKTLRQWLAAHPEAPPERLPELPGTAQTDPVARQGDAADDPAIWVHPRNGARSRILATNKKQGLLVYDLKGRQTQLLEVGRVNNVDLRQGLNYAGQRWDLAVATQRDEAALVLFGIDAAGRVRELARLPTGLDDIYGVCSLRNAAGRFEVIVNDKDGRLRQFEVMREQGLWQAALRREFRLSSQPEGCVVDEASGWLFVGEEDRGVWRLKAAADAPAQPELILPLGPLLHADVEGLAIYRRGAQRLLVVSSQGNDSYALFDAEPPHAPRGAFRIGLNARLGIDGASETDGLDVTPVNLGAPYEEGLLVVQDGRKNLPLGPQNFKLLPWRAVREALKL